MSNNQLNDISDVYLSQISEETPGERIDRKSKEGVAKRSADASSEKEARAKKAGEFQKHKQSILAKGGRHVDALDSWHKKQAYERNAKLREEIKGNKKAKKSIEPQESVANDKAEDQLVGMMSSEGWKADPVEKRKKKAADLYRREKIAQDTPAKYKTDKTEDPDKLYKRRMAVDSKTKMKKEALSDWRTDLSDIIEAGPLTSSPSLSQDSVMRDNQNLDQVPAKKKRMTQTEFEKKVDEKNVKNKVIINPTFQESIREIGGEVLEAEERKEVKAGNQEPKEKKKKLSRWDRVAYHPPGPNSTRRSYKLEQVEIEVDEDYDLVQKQRRQDAEARKHVARKETRKKAVSKVKNVVKGFLGKKETEVDEATGRWVDSKGRSHTFSFDTNIADHEYIKDLVKSRYPAERIFIKTDKVKSKKKKDVKKVKKESFSNWRDEIVECGGHHKDKMSEGEMVENLTVDRVLKGIKGNPKAQKSFQKSAEKRKGPGTVKNRAADLKLQAAKDAADTSKSDSSYAYEEIEFAVDYFYEQGIMKMV